MGDTMNGEIASVFSSASSAKKHLILLVDDDEAILEYLKPALSTNALSCITAASVAEAVAVLRQNNDIAVIVLDWGLDRCGAEVLRVARETRPNMPVIAISGLPYEVRTDAILQKVDAFLHKPLSGEVLHSQVTQLLQRVSDIPTAFLPKRAEETLPLDDVKSIYIRHVVGLLDNNVSLAAKVLGIHRQTVSAALEPAGSRAVGAGSKRVSNSAEERFTVDGVNRSLQGTEPWQLQEPIGTRNR